MQHEVVTSPPHLCCIRNEAGQDWRHMHIGLLDRYAAMQPDPSRGSPQSLHVPGSEWWRHPEALLLCYAYADLYQARYTAARPESRSSLSAHGEWSIHLLPGSDLRLPTRTDTRDESDSKHVRATMGHLIVDSLHVQYRFLSALAQRQVHTRPGQAA